MGAGRGWPPTRRRQGFNAPEGCPTQSPRSVGSGLCLHAQRSFYQALGLSDQKKDLLGPPPAWAAGSACVLHLEFCSEPPRGPRALPQAQPTCLTPAPALETPKDGPLLAQAVSAQARNVPRSPSRVFPPLPWGRAGLEPGRGIPKALSHSLVMHPTLAPASFVGGPRWAPGIPRDKTCPTLWKQTVQGAGSHG